MNCFIKFILFVTKTCLLFLRMRGVKPGTEMSSHMAPHNSRGKLTTFWIVFTKIHFCACVLFNKRDRNAIPQGNQKLLG